MIYIIILYVVYGGVFVCCLLCENRARYFSTPYWFTKINHY